MINAKTLGGELVAVLQTCPNLVQALGGDATRIQYYSENNVIFGQQTQDNVRLAILSMPPGSIMIAWQGDSKGKLGNMQMPQHNYTVFLRVPEKPGVGYEDIWYWITQDIPQGTALKMLHTNVDPLCEPMDYDLPTSDRSSVVVGQDGSTFEFFQGRISFTESVAS